jgi:hypothetical protein
MCEYLELRICDVKPISVAMQAQELKSLVEAGLYKPDPSLIAAAMLQRRGVVELLGAPVAATSAAGRIQSPPSVPRQAA